MLRRSVKVAIALLAVLACSVGWLAVQGSCSFAWRALRDVDEDVDWGQVASRIQGQPAGGKRAVAGRGGGSTREHQGLAALLSMMLAGRDLLLNACIPAAGAAMGPL